MIWFHIEINDKLFRESKTHRNFRINTKSGFEKYQISKNKSDNDNNSEENNLLNIQIRSSKNSSHEN